MILDVIVEDKKKRLPEHKKNISEIKMRELAEKYKGKKHGFYQALSKSGISIIGEFKNASPSLGKIKSKINLLNRIDEYNESVDAISCLTEEDHFDGNVDYLKKIRTITELPILRKDFMIDPYQFYEAKAIGADAVLLIAAILDDAQMKDFYQLSKELELDALVEVHDEKELERAMKIDADIIGVNNRNLKDFTISLDTTVQLSKLVPEDKVLVAESGILQDADVELLKECGVDAFLIGRALMEAEHPKEVPQIKICGITQDEEIQWLNEADVSYAGFVLYEKSCRYIPISKTQELFEKLNDNIKKVAVAVNPDVTMVKQVMDAGFDILQVHGNLTEEVLAVTEIPVWRAVNLTNANIFEELVREYRDLSIDEKITALLMDAKEFGSGKTFGWDSYERDEGKEMLRQLRQILEKEQIQFVLAGGLTPDNVSRGIDIFLPDVVDVSSGVEKEPGQGTGKDREKIQKFVRNMHSIV